MWGNGEQKRREKETVRQSSVGERRLYTATCLIWGRYAEIVVSDKREVQQRLEVQGEEVNEQLRGGIDRREVYGENSV